MKEWRVWFCLTDLHMSPLWNSGLSEGVIAAIVVSMVIFIVVLIILTIICVVVGNHYYYKRFGREGDRYCGWPSIWAWDWHAVDEIILQNEFDISICNLINCNLLKCMLLHDEYYIYQHWFIHFLIIYVCTYQYDYYALIMHN